MQAAWRLATRNLSQRASRTALLVASVALCAALITAISCAMASLTKAVQLRIEETVGAADARLSQSGGGTFPLATLRQVEAWPGVRLAVPRGRGAVPLKNIRTGVATNVIGVGIDPAREFQIRPLRIVEGKTLGDVAADEVVLEAKLAERLQAVVGDLLEVQKWGDPLRVKVVGISQQPGLSAIFDQFQAYVHLATLGKVEDKPDRVTEIDILVADKVSAEPWAKERSAAMPRSEGLRLMPSAKVSAGLQNNVRSNQIGFILASVLAFVAAGFIITTGLTTNVTERVRELSIMRCIGGTRAQLASSQLWVGALIGGLGGLVGVPLGIGAAATLVAVFPDQLPAGFSLSWLGVVLGAIGSVGAGLIGGVWPAVAAARVSPLEGLGARARPVRRGWMWVMFFGGLLCLATHAGILLAPLSNDVKFWVYIFGGVPCMMGGYFMLSVPLTRLVCRLTGTGLSAVLGLPRHLLVRTIQATPYRHGFTAGAMMLGLAMMVSLWTNGRSVMDDWLGQLQIPDAFAYFIRGVDSATQQKIRTVPGVAQTAAIADLAVELDPSQAQGVGGLQKFQTTFIAFDPEPFFSMINLTWEEPRTSEGIAKAKARLAQGGALLVAREFYIARGIGPGARLPITVDGVTADFEVVGVVHSPGLEIVSKFYSVGQDYPDQAVSAVFGTREDMKSKFKADTVRIIQIGLEESVKRGEGGRTVEKVIGSIKGIVGLGAYEIGSAVEIKRRIGEVISGALLVASVVAVGAMLVACFAVANLIIAGVQTRQFEFGVLRAIGAQRGVLGRLVIAEAIVIGVAACGLGTLMGTQAAWGGQRINQIVIGLTLSVRPPLGPILAGCGSVLVITVLASWPTAWSLVQRKPRELLAAMKG